MPMWRQVVLRTGLRLARLKLERKQTACAMASCSTTSRCTRCVAVAVSASSGTPGYLGAKAFVCPHI